MLLHVLLAHVVRFVIINTVLAYSIPGTNAVQRNTAGYESTTAGGADLCPSLKW